MVEKKKKCIMNKYEIKKKEMKLKFGMTSIPLRHAILGITL